MSTSTDRDRIAARYPGTSTITKLAVAGGLVTTVVFLVWLVWAGWSHANPAITGHVAAFDVLADDRAIASVVVQRHSATDSGTCTVIAQAVSFERVGEVKLDVPAGDKLLTSYEVPVRTLKRATSVSVLECVPTR